MFQKFLMSTTISFVLSISIPAGVMAQSMQLKDKAAASSQSQSAQTPEMKKSMADMYQKMADCMKTDKLMQDCHKEVMKDCPVAKATGSCPMMDGMKGMQGMKGMKHGKMDHGSMKDMNKDMSKDVHKDMNMDETETK